VKLDELRNKLANTATVRPEGRVLSVTGLGIRIALPGAKIGDVVRIVRRYGAVLEAEIVGLGEGSAVAIPLGELLGVGLDDSVQTTALPLEVLAGASLLGRIVDGLGRPIDGLPLPEGLRAVRIDAPAPAALGRVPIQERLVTGIRAIDALMPIGRGQRVGLFSGSGVGKSSLLGAIARNAQVDAVVVALVGERGREVREFLDHSLDAEARKRAILVVATSDATALERLRAAQTATALAEALRDEGKHVLLLVDSITRFARAQREVGLAAGEPPARRGYPPSVFAAIPRLVERAGTASRGAITAFYTVLVEGGDLDEPVSDEVRGTLDGHIILERHLAARGHYPPIDVVHSLSRVASAITPQKQLAMAATLRQAVAHFEAKRELVALGAYVSGSDPLLDRVIAHRAPIERFLRQSTTEPSAIESTLAGLSELAAKLV
jgi:type III secretion protein N (ATPase)